MAAAGINMFHIHCGRPGQLDPIIVDFGLLGDVSEFFADGALSLEITNAPIVATKDHGHGLVGAVTVGCPITPALPTNKVVTVAGMAHFAAERELCFKLHTRAQTFFGTIPARLYPVP